MSSRDTEIWRGGKRRDVESLPDAGVLFGCEELSSEFWDETERSGEHACKARLSRPDVKPDTGRRGGFPGE